MKTKRWLKPFCLSVIFHFIVLAVVADRFSLSATATDIPEKQYIEVELGAAPPAGQTMENQVEAKVQETIDQRPQVPIVSQNEHAVMSASTAADKAAVQMAATGNTGMDSGGAVSASGGSAQSGSITGTKESSGNGRGGSGKGDNDRPYVVYGPVPQYPNQARTNSWEGTVRVKVLVAESGIVHDVRLASSSGYGSLDQAALDGVHRWQFKPAYQDGSPVTAWVIVPVIFELN